MFDLITKLRHHLTYLFWSFSKGKLSFDSNIKHLMLREDVVEAVSAGQFHIYPVEFIDQGIEVLSGMPAGERGGEGNYAEGSINYLVEKRLAELALKRAEFSAPTGESEP